MTIIRKIYNSIFFRILVIYFITILPVYAIFLTLNNLTINDIYAEKSETIINHTMKGVSLLEEELKRILDTQQMITANNSEIMILRHTYPIVHPYELGKLVYHINNSLWTIKSTSSLVESVSLYIPAIERELSTDRYYDEVTEETRLIYRYLMKVPTEIVNYGTLKPMLCTYNKTAPSKVFPEYFICTTLSESGLYSMLDISSADVFWVMHNDNFTLTNDSKNAHYIIYYSSEHDVSDEEIITTKLSIDSTDHIVSYTYSPTLDCIISYYTPESSIISNMQKYSHIIVLLGVCSTAGAFVLIFALYIMVKQPLTQLLKAFSRMESGNLDAEINYKSKNEFGMLFKYFNKMLKQLKDVIDQVYISQINLKKAQFKQLQAQISPHFLYNSFNILNHSIRRDDNETALRMTEHLAYYFKYITNNIDEETTLREEFDFAKAYLNIQKIRFRDRIRIDFKDIADPYKDLMVPRMLIQPLIENCYKHGFKSVESGGYLCVDWYVEGNDIKIIIQDNGDGVSAKKLEELRNMLNTNSYNEYTGLQNVNQRLKLKYGSEYGLEIDSRSSGYFKVTITLPIGKENQNV